MPVHLDAVAVDVDGLAPLLGELDRELERKSVGRREREGLLARDRLVGADLFEELEPALERLEKALLLEPKDTSDPVRVLGKLGVGIGHLLDDHAGEAMHVVEADPLRLLHRPADDASQDVAAALVRRRHPVAHEERHPTSVVGHDPVGFGRRRRIPVPDTGLLGDPVHDLAIAEQYAERSTEPTKNCDCVAGWIQGGMAIGSVLQ